MPALIINVHISPRAAIMAGKTVAGASSFTLTEEMLVGLPDELRLELAIAYQSSEAIGTDPNEPAVVEASMDAIRPVLVARAGQRKRLEEAKRIEDARKAEQAAVTSREITAKDNLRSKALRDWINANGDDEQKARMSEGFLPEDEILADITEELLDLPGFPVYEALRRGEACDCACAHQVEFCVGPPKYMDAFQFTALQSARESLPKDALVQPIEHRAACPACKCVPIARISARATLAWNGWELVREYRLI
jgi:hypothetical protein